MHSNDQQASRSDRRDSPRYPYGTVQQITRLVNGGVQSCDVFESVACVDISGGGFSFYRGMIPQWDSLVVALGKPPHRVFLTAEIVNSEKVDHDGHKMYRIGCRFTGRLNLRDADIRASRLFGISDHSVRRLLWQVAQSLPRRDCWVPLRAGAMLKAGAMPLLVAGPAVWEIS